MYITINICIYNIYVEDLFVYYINLNYVLSIEKVI